MTQIQNIKAILDPYDSTQTECDGMSRICHTILSQHQIRHQTMIGTLRFEEQYIEPHFWIDLPTRERIDYRARMWLDDSVRVPHGVFQPLDFPNVIYEGEPIELKLLSPASIQIMTTKFDVDKFFKSSNCGQRSWRVRDRN